MNPIEINRTDIDNIFETSENQLEAWISLYKLIYPEWDNIKQVIGYPKVSEALDLYIIDKFLDFDRKNHPTVFAGGMWMNQGWSMDKKLKGDVVVPAEYVLKEDE